mmetsp:Transcript_5051/g.7304  ORF Transcript_5051/g.7304 Transcript_5051/m.7304 type:complete len:503 (+) Transcript_5051:75-1583(+)
MWKIPVVFLMTLTFGAMRTSSAFRFLIKSPRTSFVLRSNSRWGDDHLSSRKISIDSLLGSAMRRAVGTLETKGEIDSNTLGNDDDNTVIEKTPGAVDNYLSGSTVKCAVNTLETKGERNPNILENDYCNTIVNKNPDAVASLLGSAVRRAVETLEINGGGESSNPLENDAGKIKTEKTSEVADGLMNSVVERAVGVLDTADGETTTKKTLEAVDAVLESAVRRATDMLESKEMTEFNPLESNDSATTIEKIPIEWSYIDNPCIHFTALAHKQWEHVLIPGIDAAIDATCGNGNDSKKLASILFPNNSAGASELICVDVQHDACLATKDAILEAVDFAVFNENVQVLQTSHASLPVTKAPLGLVCWNLGHLPNSGNREICTQVESTIASITAAVLSLRIGGLLSIMTYPKTNADEDYAVRTLLECLALLSSKTIDYNQLLESLEHESHPEEKRCNLKKIKEVVTEAMARIVDEGGQDQAWRVMDHKMMGRPFSPILLTAIRIK